MKIYNTNQDIFLCTSQYELLANTRRLDNFYNIFSQNYKNVILYKGDSGAYMENIITQFNSKLYSGNIGNKIYFNPKSKFPRFKLQGTDFKRTIKPEKADVIVVPKAIKSFCYRFIDIKVYEGNNSCLYGITSSIFTHYFKSETEFKNSIKNWMNLDLEYKETVTFSALPNSSIYVLDVINNKYNKPIITDDMLDLEVSKTLATMTESDIDSIDSMLASTDSSVVELGLKTLCGFNVFETPTIIKTLLCKNYYNFIKNKAVDSVSVRKMLNSVDMFRGNPGSFPGWMYCLGDKNEKYSDFEVQQVKRLLTPLFKDYVEKNMLRTKNDCGLPFIPKLVYSIE